MKIRLITVLVVGNCVAGCGARSDLNVESERDRNAREYRDFSSQCENSEGAHSSPRSPIGRYIGYSSVQAFERGAMGEMQLLPGEQEGYIPDANEISTWIPSSLHLRYRLCFLRPLREFPRVVAEDWGECWQRHYGLVDGAEINFNVGGSPTALPSDNVLVSDAQITLRGDCLRYRLVIEFREPQALFADGSIIQFVGLRQR